MKTRDKNIANIEAVARGLGDLLGDITFVGGAATTLYVDDPGAADARPTFDVDCVIEVTSHVGFARLEKRLRKLGFTNGVPDEPICRWHYRDLTVDVMPTDASILGFSNAWYRDGIVSRQRVELPGGTATHIFSVPYFLATKLEAFKGRGDKDWLASKDVEDVVAVLDGRRSIAADLANAEDRVHEYLVREFRVFLRRPDHDDIIRAHLPGDATSSARAGRVADVLAAFVKGAP
jgi:predicted nucleotidyltransferase